MLRDHPLTGAGIAVLKGETLGVGPVGQKNRIAAIGHRPEYVGAEDKAVVHGNGDVPLDAHAVSNLHAPILSSPRATGKRRLRRWRTIACMLTSAGLT